MAEHAYSIPAPAVAPRPLTPWGLNALLDMARASHIAVASREKACALFSLEDRLWHRLADYPIQGPQDARAKLEALLSDPSRREDIGTIGTRLIADVSRYLDGQL